MAGAHAAFVLAHDQGLGEGERRRGVVAGRERGHAHGGGQAARAGRPGDGQVCGDRGLRRCRLTLRTCDE